MGGGGSEDSRQPPPPPKIWSLARTATSDSPPAHPRKPPHLEFEEYGTDADRSGVFCDRSQLTCGRKEDPKHHPTSFCDVDCKTQQVPFYVDERTLKQHPISSARGFCKGVDGADDKFQVAYYAEENGRKSDTLKSHPISSVPFCKGVDCADEERETLQVPYYAEGDGQKSDALKNHPLSKDRDCHDHAHDQDHDPFCKVDECELKVDCEMKQVPFYVGDKGVLNKLQVPYCDDAKDQVPFYLGKGAPNKLLQVPFCDDPPKDPMVFCHQDKVYRDFGERTSVAKDPCLFAKCEDASCVVGGGDRGSCMMQQQQPYPLPYPATLGDAYAPGGSRSNYFVASDRFDQTTMLGSKEDGETH